MMQGMKGKAERRFHLLFFIYTTPLSVKNLSRCSPLGCCWLIGTRPSRGHARISHSNLSNTQSLCPFSKSTASFTILPRSCLLIFAAVMQALSALSAIETELDVELDAGFVIPKPYWTIFSSSTSDAESSPVIIVIALSNSGSSNAVGSARTWVLSHQSFSADDIKE